MKKRILSVLLAICMITWFCQFVVSANDNQKITVEFSAFDGSFLVPKRDVVVYDGVAEEYGYTVAQKDHNGVKVSDVTFFDALVQAHKDYYGDLFTKETAENFLVMNSGYITLAFGKSAGASQFVINDVIPTDGIINPDYGSFTSYSCDATRIKNNDKVTYFYFQDRTYYSDYYTFFDYSELTTQTNNEITLNLRGYCAMWFGFSDKETIEENTFGMPQIDVFITSDRVNFSSVGKTDGDGNITFTVPNEGEYLICAKGSFLNEYDALSPIVSPWCELFVVDPSKNITVNDDSNMIIDYKNNTIFGLVENENFVSNIAKQIKSNAYTLQFTDAFGNTLSQNSFVGTGTNIKMIDENQNVIDEVTVILFGDVTGDGVIDAFDVTFASSYISFEIDDSDLMVHQIKASDLTDDDVIDELDLSEFNLASIFISQISQRGNFS